MKIGLAWLLLAFAVAIQAQTVDHPLDIGGDVQAPRLARQVDLSLPAEALNRRRSVSVGVRMVVGPDGVPSRITVAESTISREYEDLLKQQIEQQYRFLPATRKGTPVAVNLSMAVFIDPF